MELDWPTKSDFLYHDLPHFNDLEPAVVPHPVVARHVAAEAEKARLKMEMRRTLGEGMTHAAGAMRITNNDDGNVAAVHTATTTLEQPMNCEVLCVEPGVGENDGLLQLTQLRSAFMMMDKNGDGKVNRTEIVIA